MGGCRAIRAGDRVAPPGFDVVQKKIPASSHDWKMFIRPHTILEALEASGLRNQELRGLALKGGLPGVCLRAATGEDPWVFEVGTDTRVSCLGCAVEPA